MTNQESYPARYVLLTIEQAAALKQAAGKLGSMVGMKTFALTEQNSRQFAIQWAIQNGAEDPMQAPIEIAALSSMLRDQAAEQDQIAVILQGPDPQQLDEMIFEVEVSTQPVEQNNPQASP